MAETKTAAPATAAENGESKKRKMLPKITRVHKTRDAAVEAQKDAFTKGYKEYAVRSFEVKLGKAPHQATFYVLGYSENHAYGLVAESGLYDAECVEFGAKPKEKRKAITPDGVMAALNNFSEADKERIKKVLLAQKAGK